jgi:hypothetical protein
MIDLIIADEHADHTGVPLGTVILPRRMIGSSIPGESLR